MKKKVLATLLSLAMIVGLLPSVAFAEEPVDSVSILYVSRDGNDVTGDGSNESPYQTIQKAYEGAQDNSTICLLTDIVLDHTVRINKTIDVTLTSVDPQSPVKITMGENFDEDSGGETCILYIGDMLNYPQAVAEPSNPSIAVEHLVLDAESKSRVIRLNSGVLTLGNGAVVRNGRNVNQGGYIGPNDWGGGIVVDYGAKLIMEEGSEISGCTAEWGGGVHLSGEMIMNGGVVKENKAIGDTNSDGHGGGILLYAFRSDVADGAFTSMAAPKLTINDGSIKNNSAEGPANAFGGGILAIGDLHGYYGGTAVADPYTIIINGGEISNNQAKCGAGVMAYFNDYYEGKANITMNNGEISNNIASSHGGGVMLWMNTTQKTDYMTISI